MRTLIRSNSPKKLSKLISSPLSFSPQATMCQNLVYNLHFVSIFTCQYIYIYTYQNHNSQAITPTTLAINPHFLSSTMETSYISSYLSELSLDLSSAFFLVVTLLSIYITHWTYRWRNPKCNGVLPPGSMGLPLIGETIQLVIPSASLDLPPFIKHRMKK